MKCPVCGGEIFNCSCMYDFSEKSCEVCGKSFKKVYLGYIIDGINAPFDSLCFCNEHQPFFLDEIKRPWWRRFVSGG